MPKWSSIRGQGTFTNRTDTLDKGNDIEGMYPWRAKGSYSAFFAL